ncbi:hypothetical protein AHAS_Ahas19G0108900 [Arachis hypogaea]
MTLSSFHGLKMEATHVALLAATTSCATETNLLRFKPRISISLVPCLPPSTKLPHSPTLTSRFSTIRLLQRSR